MTTMNRRDFLGASALLAGLGLAGCANNNTPAEERVLRLRKVQ